MRSVTSLSSARLCARMRRVRKVGRREDRPEQDQGEKKRHQSALVPGRQDLERELDRRAPVTVGERGSHLQAIRARVEVGVVAERFGLRLGPGALEADELELVAQLSLRR